MFSTPVVEKVDGEQLLLPVLSVNDGAPVEISGEGLDFWNGFGGFSSDGREYVTRLRGGEATPQPWINVISNETFGFHVAAEGAGFIWSRNSRDYQLTSWTNDPVINRPGEAIFIRDTESGAVLTPYGSLSRRKSVMFETRHGLGYSSFSSTQDGIAIEATQTVDREAPVKHVRLSLKNTGSETRNLKLYGYVEWVLGNNRAKTAPFVLAQRDEETGALLASNPYSIDYSGRAAFLAASVDANDFTTSRREFLGRGGSLYAPQAVIDGAALSGAVDADGDPCAALAFDFVLKPGETREAIFYIGDADNAEQAIELVRSARKIAFADIVAASTASGTTLPACCRSKRRTRRSTRWSMPGFPTRVSDAASWHVRPFIRPAAPMASVTSCRIRWPSSSIVRSWRNPRFSMRRRGSSPRVTFCIGGCRAMARVFAR